MSEARTGVLLVDSPLSVAATIARWARDSGTLNSLMEEHRSSDYQAVNLPVGLLFSHFLAYNQDKFLKPEFFCWPGAWMAGARVSPEIEEVFDRHLAPFIDTADDGGIYPRLMAGKTEGAIQEAFENFYAIISACVPEDESQR